MPHKKATKPAPVETVATLLSTNDAKEQAKRVKALLAEVVHHYQTREIFVNIVYAVSTGGISIRPSNDATLDEVLTVLKEAEKRVIEAGVKAGLEAEKTKERGEGTKPPDRP